MTADSEPRQVGLSRALQEFEAILAKRDDEQPVDFEDLTHLAVYRKP